MLLPFFPHVKFRIRYFGLIDARQWFGNVFVSNAFIRGGKLVLYGAKMTGAGSGAGVGGGNFQAIINSGNSAQH